jgi:peptide/nickel transport system substrate-binding protein
LPTAGNGGLSKDHLTVTWKLKSDLKWSDGKPLTSDDVKFTWEAVTNPNSGVLYTGGFDKIESIETPDASTIVVRYKEPYPAYLTQFWYGIMPRHATGDPAKMGEWEWNRKPVGAGPYVVSEWKAGESITMERNPNYFEQGKPYLDKLIFKIIPEPAAQTAIMSQGDAEVHLWPSESTEDYNKQVAGKAKVVMVPGVWNMAIDFNLSRPGDKDPSAKAPHPLLGDIRVRQSIAHAIDYNTLSPGVVKDTIQSTNPFAYGWYQCDIPRKYAYDLNAAKKLLEEAGWVEGSDGIRVAKGAKYAKDGTRLSLEMMGYTNYEPLQKTEEFIVENLKAVGIEARIQNVDFSIIFGSFTEGAPSKLGDFDMLIYDRSFTIEPGGQVSNRFSSKNIPSKENPNGGNEPRWVNPEADKLIDEANTSFDLAKRKQDYCKLGQLIVDELPELYFYLLQDGYGFSDKLHGYTVSTWGTMTWDVANWWLEP